jgi:hypothetical protein
MLIDLKASKGSGIGAVRRIKKQHLESPLNFESEVRLRELGRCALASCWLRMDDGLHRSYAVVILKWRLE